LGFGCEENMDDDEVISSRWMLIGLRLFSVFLIVAGALFGIYGESVRTAWAAEEFSSAIGLFFGRFLFWFVLAVYAWIHSGKYRSK